MIRPAIRPALAALALVAAPAFAHGDDSHDHSHDDTRELGAHVHGHATLSIAVENGEVAMELEAPGADVVGFEHAPETDADLAAARAAAATLENPLALFALSPAAGCTLTTAEVRLVALGPDGAEDIGLDDHDHGHGHDDHDHDGHTEFRADYRIACTDPDQLVSLDLGPWFAAFPSNAEVDVNLVDDAGGRAFAATPGAPSVDLAGAM